MWISGLVFLVWMYIPFFGCCFLLWISDKCDICSVPGRAYFCGSGGNKGMLNVYRPGGKSEGGTKKDLVNPWVHTKRWNLQGMEVGGRRDKTSSILVQ